jgi:hypothetical protein
MRFLKELAMSNEAMHLVVEIGGEGGSLSLFVSVN